MVTIFDIDFESKIVEIIEQIEKHKRISSNEMMKSTYNARVKQIPKRTFDAIGKTFGVSRQHIEQTYKETINRLKTRFNKDITEINNIVKNSFEEFGNIIPFDPNKIPNSYENVISLFFDFCIYFDTGTITPKDKPINILYKDIIKQFESKGVQFYNSKEILYSIEQSLPELKAKCSEGVFKNLTNGLKNQFLEVYNKQLIELEPDYYSFSDKSLKSPEIANKRLLYNFKKIYPNGVPLPQEEKNKDIFIKNIEPLIENFSELRGKAHRHILQNKIVNNADIVDYDTGRYIHIDYFNDLYKANSDFINKLNDEIAFLFDENCNEINARKLFDESEEEFLNSNIETYEILFYLLKVSEIDKIAFRRKNRALLFGSPNLNEDDRVELEGRVGISKLSSLKKLLESNKLNKIVDFDLEGNEYKKQSKQEKVEYFSKDDKNNIVLINEIQENIENQEELIYQEKIENMDISDSEINEFKNDHSHPEQGDSKGNKYWKRNPTKAKAALKKAMYCCEFDNKHLTFKSNKSNMNFVEAHHLIPMKFQKEDRESLDNIDNIVALCPNCHRAIHNATFEYKKELIKSLFLQRETRLTNRGINLTLDELNQCY